VVDSVNSGSLIAFETTHRPNIDYGFLLAACYRHRSSLKDRRDLFFSSLKTIETDTRS
jgi:hypothetical protein